MHIQTLYQNSKKFLFPFTVGLALCVHVFFSDSTQVYAEGSLAEQMEQQKELPIQSNEITDWPEGPVISAQSAILMEMNTHTILYAKNIDEKNYPASTTKILTALLASQNCSMDETVSFSTRAVYDVPRDASNMGMDAGETLTMEQALYGVLVASANEAASAVGEHIAQKLGKEATPEAFASIMNEKAKELGCENTHFVNANGLFDENHYTTAYDLALIGCEFFQNEMLCKMSSTPTYHIPVTSTQPDDIWISSKNRLLKNREYEYPYLLGSKTGYVEQARQTLVSAASKDGLQLVCVVFKEETPNQFIDTATLFEYGFSNFQKQNVSQKETKYNIDQNDNFSTDNDLFGDSTPLLYLDENAYVVIPRDADFTDLSSTIDYQTEQASSCIASISYTYHNQPVGTCDVLYSVEQSSFSFTHEQDTPVSMDASAQQDIEETTPVLFVNVKNVIFVLLGIALLIWVISSFITFINSYHFSPKGQSKKRRRGRLKEKRILIKKAHSEERARKQLLRQRKKAYKKRKRSGR